MKKSICDALLHYFPSLSKYEDHFSAYITNCVFNGFLSFTAIALNITAIHAIRRTSSLPETLKTLLVSLAVSDVGVGLLVQPFYISLVVKWLQQSDPGCATYKAFITIAGFFSNTARKIGFVAHLILVKGEVKYADNFDCTFDARQRRIKYVEALTKPLSHVKGKVKCSNNFDLTFDPRQR